MNVLETVQQVVATFLLKLKFFEFTVEADC